MCNISSTEMQSLSRCVFIYTDKLKACSLVRTINQMFNLAHVIDLLPSWKRITSDASMHLFEQLTTSAIVILFSPTEVKYMHVQYCFFAYDLLDCREEQTVCHVNAAQM
jgi:hypothetical protein